MVVFGEVVVGGIGGGYGVGSAVGCGWCYSPRAACPSMEDFAATASKT